MCHMCKKRQVIISFENRDSCQSEGHSEFNCLCSFKDVEYIITHILLGSTQEATRSNTELYTTKNQYLKCHSETLWLAFIKALTTSVLVIMPSNSVILEATGIPLILLRYMI